MEEIDKRNLEARDHGGDSCFVGLSFLGDWVSSLFFFSGETGERLY